MKAAVDIEGELEKERALRACPQVTGGSVCARGAIDQGLKLKSSLGIGTIDVKPASSSDGVRRVDGASIEVEFNLMKPNSELERWPGR